MGKARIVLWVSALLICAAARAPAQEVVDLSYAPASQSVLPGQQLEIGLIATSATGSDIAMAGMRVIIEWDETKLRLLGHNDNGPYDWLGSGFFNDLMLDALNDGATAPDYVPANDGDAYYECSSQFPPQEPGTATPGGLLVTSFVFEALEATGGSGTLITMPITLGNWSETMVVSGTDAGVDILGSTGQATIVVLPDCNENGVDDSQDLMDQTSPDCNGNGIPDECEIDENSPAPGGPFFCTENCAADCQPDGVPDECQLENNDCQNGGLGNGIPDTCENDCNCNDVDDSEDVASGSSDDCQPNGIPDECETDCQEAGWPGSGVPDDCDIRDGTSQDINSNGVPDECDFLCMDNGECDDGNVCTFDECLDFICLHPPNMYGDLNHDDVINVYDLFCMLNAFAGQLDCAFDDIYPCEGDDNINIYDLFAVLNAYAGTDACCGTTE